MRNLKKLTLAYGFAGLFCVFGPAQAADLTTTNVVGGNTGWNTSNIWKTNGTGTAVTGPVAGNTYQCVFNGTPWGNNLGNTRMRNLYASTSQSPQPFPGDSLTLNTNTEFRFKRVAAGNVPVVVFPGVGGNAGLILNGGVLNAGDDDTYTIAGTIRVDSQSYICPGNNGGGGPTAAGRGFNITASISGSGNLVFLQGSNYVAQTFAGNNEAYSGTLIIKSALLRATGLNSLGTNSNVILDPSYSAFVLDPSVIDYSGPAILEPMYDVNSAGTLTLRNGGQIRLHQNCAFTAVNIDGTPLAPGTHYYADLAVAYPGNFPAGGSGAITVKPYGALPLVFQTHPQPLLMMYSGRTATLTASATGAATISYQWRRNGVNLSDSGNISGASTQTLRISNLSSADQGNYDVVASAGSNSTTSRQANLTVVVPTGEAYEAAVLAANPSVYYRLNETADPASNASAFDYAGGGVATYGTGVQNGNSTYNISGPSAPAFTGLSSNNKAAQFANAVPTSRITTAPFNLSTNALTITAWVNPNGPQMPYAGVVFSRGSGTTAGLNYTGSTDPLGNTTLGYTWNNEGETWRWDSGIAPTPGVWSLVALVVSPVKATLYVMNANGEFESSYAYSHVIQGFAGAGLIGDDSGGANGLRVFNGIIDEVAVFSAALSKADLMNLYTAAAGSSTFAAKILSQPPSPLQLYRGQTAQFRVVAGGSEPLTYQWKAGPIGGGTYANLTDNGRISGATTPILVITNISDSDGLDYVVTVQNSGAQVTSTPASLYVQPTSPAELITMSAQQPGGDNWDGFQWSDGQPASASAASKPGSTYELLGGARMRTPETNRTSVFPGTMLTLRGSSIWVNNPAATDTSISEIRFKQPNPGRVNFPRLVMNGGQLDSGNDGVVELGGRIDILTNAPFYNDSGNDRGYLVDAVLTGAGTIEYRGYNQAAFMSNYINNLNIAGNSNTFSGKWNVVLGTLLATGANALGTNDITIGAGGAFEPCYDILNNGGSLFLSGRMYLHQNHTFKSVFVNGTPLNVGTYTFSQLNATYPNNFPAAWMPKAGATNFTTGSGSITVLVQPAPVIVQQPVSVSVYPSQDVQFTVAAQGTPVLVYGWRRGGVFLVDGGNLSGATNSTLSITSVTPANTGNYDVVVTNLTGSVTSQVATLTLLPTGPALNLSLDYGGAPIVQAQGADWNTLNQWTDGRAASVSALANPGTTFSVPGGARLRSTAAATASVFPGEVITVEGDGVYMENSTTAGEIRFKHASPGSVYFKRLVMNGGMLDSGDNGIIAIQGRMDIQANTPIYADSGAGQDRPWQIDAWLTGSGTVEYHAFNNSFTGNLNITGTSNTFSGKWNIAQGVLLGSGPNSLGTNEIKIDLNSALETLYDIKNYSGTLLLDGQMFLHQNDTFKAATVAGTPLSPGTYTFAQLNTAYPLNFPATWPQQIGSTFSTGSGSITVLGDAPPDVTLFFRSEGGNLVLTWSYGTLLEADNITGPWNPVGAPSPYTVTPNPATPRKFYKVQVR